MGNDKVETDSFSWNEWIGAKSSKRDGVILSEDSKDDDWRGASAAEDGVDYKKGENEAKTYEFDKVE